MEDFIGAVFQYGPFKNTKKEVYLSIYSRNGFHMLWILQTILQLCSRETVHTLIFTF